MKNREIKILHLYPELLNLYGDKGNIEAFKKRLLWRNIDVNVIELTGAQELDSNDIDIVFLGGGSDREQDIVCNYLKPYKESIKAYVENNGVLLATCGGFAMLGKTFYNMEKETEGIGVLDIKTLPSDRFMGNIILESDLIANYIVGFENRYGVIEIGDYKPLGKVVFGKGNTGNGQMEGLVYKNLIATNLHGPLLPKNPMLCDYILGSALKKKYDDFDVLAPLDDTLENLANEEIKKRYI